MATKTIKVKVGETFDIPIGSQIIGIYSDSFNIEVDSACKVLPAIQRFQCFILKWSIEYTATHIEPNLIPPFIPPFFTVDDPSGPWKWEDMKIIEFGIGDNVYPIPSTIAPDGGSYPKPDNPFSINFILDDFLKINLPPELGVVYGMYADWVGERADVNLYIKCPPDIGPTAYLSFQGGGVKNTKVYAVSSDTGCGN